MFVQTVLSALLLGRPFTIKTDQKKAELFQATKNTLFTERFTSSPTERFPCFMTQ